MNSTKPPTVFAIFTAMTCTDNGENTALWTSSIMERPIIINGERRWSCPSICYLNIWVCSYGPSIEGIVSASLVRHYIIYVVYSLTGILLCILCMPRMQSISVVSAIWGPCLSGDVIIVARGSIEVNVSASLVRHYIIHVVYSLTGILFCILNIYSVNTIQ